MCKISLFSVIFSFQTILQKLFFQNSYSKIFSKSFPTFSQKKMSKVFFVRLFFQNFLENSFKVFNFKKYFFRVFKKIFPKIIFPKYFESIFPKLYQKISEKILKYFFKYIQDFFKIFFQIFKEEFFHNILNIYYPKN